MSNPAKTVHAEVATADGTQWTMEHNGSWGILSTDSWMGWRRGQLIRCRVSVTFDVAETGQLEPVQIEARVYMGADTLSVRLGAVTYAQIRCTVEEALALIGKETSDDLNQ